jgi:thiamine kinase-like enzyme
MKLSREQTDLYIKNYLLAQLSRDNASYHFELTDRGQRSTITYLSIEDFKPLVLKGTKKKRKAEHMWEGTHHLQSHDIKVPEIIYLDLSRRTFKQFGCYFVCEEKIEGKVYEELDNPINSLPLVAEAFARLHHIKRAGWGRVDSGKRYRFWSYLKSTIKEKLRRVRAYTNLFSSKQCEFYWHWFTTYKDKISRYKIFSLSHCDPHMHNVLISNTQEVYLLDIDALRYLPLSIDFYKLQYNFCQDDAEKITRWQQAYLSHLPKDEADEFNESKDFFHSYVLLDFAQREAYSLSHLKDKTEHYNPCPISLKKARDLMEEVIKG